ncbi:MAG TPA: M28 family peptidase [Solirubrobacteraceae bacterium]|nr:M28 family peptidase [Solirubrobacteraceae bacterium]
MRSAVLALLAVLLVLPATASGNHPQPARDISLLPYVPEGHFKAGDPVPAHDQCEEDLLPLTSGKKFNPSGVYNAFDNNVFEVLCLPFRAAGDQSNADPYGNGPDTDDDGQGDNQNPVHGHCAPNPEPRPGPEANWSPIAGECPNHQLEYIDYFEETMLDILGQFGAVTHRYGFMNPGGSNTLAGTAYNPAIVVPGGDHANEHIVIGAHFDQTTDGPASAWDSAEGHAQVIRVAKLMADYWNATGTRPAATVKFIPWDGEESGTLGSRDYANNNIVPGEEDKVRGYWNTDPCAGGYPAWRNGNPNDRVTLGIQIARPAEVPDEFDNTRVQTFNDAAPQIVEDVFEHLDDTTPNNAGDQEVFISAAEAAADGEGGKQPDLRPGGPVTIGAGRPQLFSSDWVNFLNKGVPFFNPGPEITGPSDENEPGNPDALVILHTPNDNIVTLNKYTGDPTGQMFSEPWMDGMEMCAHLLAWGMLRADQGGAQTNDTEVVAYYEALPNEAEVKKPVTFDAAGSYRYANAATRELVPDAQLAYSWDFGDGTSGEGEKVDHLYAQPGIYQSKLTVTDTVTGQTDTMSIPITVIGAALDGPTMGDIPELDPDGNFELRWSYDEAGFEGFQRYEVEEATDYRTAFNDPGQDIAGAWEVQEPTEPSIQPWQHSDEASGSVRGNLYHSGERSFYTGIDREDQRPFFGPNYGVSKLRLKNPIQLGEDAELTYYSMFVNDLNDTMRVEAAVDDGSGNYDWKVVDRRFMDPDEDFCNVEVECQTAPTEFELRRADLSRFANQKIRLQFVYSLGGAQYINVYRSGWYVDDIRVDTGTFRNIGEPDTQTFSVTGRTLGSYSYRVRAVHADATSRYSAVETVGVAALPPGGPQPPPVTQPPQGLPPSTRCTLVSGFRSARVQPTRDGGLRFAFRRRSRAPVRVDVFRQSSGRRILGNRRVAFFGGRQKSFTWRARGRKVIDGSYVVRLSIPVRRARDARRFALLRRNGRFRLRRAFYRRPNCGLLTRYRLTRTVFGGRRRAPLTISYRLSRQARVTIRVLRGRRVVRRLAAGTRAAGRYHRVRLPARGLGRGEYKIRLTAVAGNTRVVSTLGARRL